LPHGNFRGLHSILLAVVQVGKIRALLIVIVKPRAVMYHLPLNDCNSRLSARILRDEMQSYKRGGDAGEMERV
jgi:hypothetical protein